MAKFRCTVNAYGTFVVEAEDMYEADELVQVMSRKQIIEAVNDDGGWSDLEVNDSEFPEEV